MRKKPLNFSYQKEKKEKQQIVEGFRECIKETPDLHQKLKDCHGESEYEAALRIPEGMKDSDCSGLQVLLADRLCPILEKVDGIFNIFGFTKELVRKLIFPQSSQEMSIAESLTSSPVLIAKFRKFSRPLVKNLLPHEKKEILKARDLFMQEYRLFAIAIRGTWQNPDKHETYDFEAFLDGVSTKIEKKFKMRKLHVVKEDTSISETEKATAIASLLISERKEEVIEGIDYLAGFYSNVLCEVFNQLKFKCNIFQLSLKLFPEIAKKSRFENVFPIQYKKDNFSEKLSEIKAFFLKQHAPCFKLIEDFWNDEEHQNLYSFTKFILHSTRFGNPPEK